MLESAPNQQDFTPGGYDPAQAEFQLIQQQLAEHGITASPQEALTLSRQKLFYDIRRKMQQELAEQGIDATPDEVIAINRLRFLHNMMIDTGTTDPHEALERMLSDNPPKPYEPNE